MIYSRRARINNSSCHANKIGLRLASQNLDDVHLASRTSSGVVYTN